MLDSATVVIARALQLLAILSLAAAGCAFRTPETNLPSAIAGDGPGPARLEVSSIDVGAIAGTVDAWTDNQVRDATSAILYRSARDSFLGDGPARVRVAVLLGGSISDFPDTKEWGRGVMLLLPAFAVCLTGITYERQALSVSVSVTRGRRSFTGSGAAWRDGSLYAPALKRALAVALDRALSDAAAHERVD
jgi:hypothetical protein